MEFIGIALIFLFLLLYGINILTLLDTNSGSISFLIIGTVLNALSIIGLFSKGV